jgi:amidase
VHPDCRDAVRDAAALCEELGHEVVEDAPTYDAERLWHAFTQMLSAGVAWAIDDWARTTGRTPTEALFEPMVWALASRGRELTAPDYLLLLQDLQRISRDVVAFFSDYHVWLTPTLGEPPVPLGTLVYSDGDPFALRRRQAAFSPFTYLSNITGQPAMSVPLYWSDEGLPMGTHYTGRPGDEATLLRLAAQLEAARPWAGRRPPLPA